MHRNLRFFHLYLTCLGMLLISTVVGEAKAVSSRTDDIVITAEATKGTNGKTRITCSITNESAHVIASAYRRGNLARSFQIRLKDKVGKYLFIDGHWSRKHSQVNEYPGVDGSLNSKSLTVIRLLPSEKAEFAFDLEDAYGELAILGKELEVIWRNRYPDARIVIGNRKLLDGSFEDIYGDVTHFQGKRNFAVTLPLPDAGTETPAAVESPKVVESRLPASHAPQPPLAPAKLDSKLAPNYWWWLLVIPVMLLLYLGARWIRQKL